MTTGTIFAVILLLAVLPAMPVHGYDWVSGRTLRFYYTGTINYSHRIQMDLGFDGIHVRGAYFYEQQGRDTRIGLTDDLNRS